MRYVNGFAYSQMLPAPEEEIPQRFARAERGVRPASCGASSCASGTTTSKPAAIAKHRELQSVDPDALSDEELVDYLGRCRDHHSAMITQHMRYTASAVVPTGDFLAHVGDWTGLPPSELLGLMRGASPVSAGASVELERLIAAIRQRPGRAGAARLRRRSRPSRSTRCARSTATWARRCPAYLDLVGYRLLDGFDISRAVRARAARRAAAGDPTSPSRAERRGRRTSRIGSRPSATRCPRSTGPSSTSCSARRGCSTGSATSAASTATSGPRGSCAGPCSPPAAALAARGPHPRAGAPRRRRLRRDVRAASRGAGGPSADELAARAAYRAAHSAKDAPATLGPPPPPPPDPSGAAAGGRPADARHGHRAGCGVRQLGGGARGAHAARPRGEPRRLRRAGAPRLRPVRLRPDRPGRRPRHRCRRPRRSTSCCRCSARS